MKVAIDVKNRDEAEAVKRAMDDPVMRATVLVFGTLMQLDTARARRRVVQWALDKMDEEESKEATA